MLYSSFCFVWFQVVFPLQWQCAYIPLCPLGLSDMLFCVVSGCFPPTVAVCIHSFVSPGSIWHAVLCGFRLFSLYSGSVHTFLCVPWVYLTCCFVWFQVVFPLQWQCAYIPLCPLGLSDMLFCVVSGCFPPTVAVCIHSFVSPGSIWHAVSTSTLYCGYVFPNVPFILCS